MQLCLLMKQDLERRTPLKISQKVPTNGLALQSHRICIPRKEKAANGYFPLNLARHKRGSGCLGPRKDLKERR